MSHLLQMRGLKLYLKCKKMSAAASHLLQMRGLKLRPKDLIIIYFCRIFYRCVD